MLQEEGSSFSKEEDLLVSVFMLTYNQENYIAQAIEGVLLQKTSFKIELVIGEDGSTDNTRLICENYKKNNPDIIRLLPSQENLGLISNYVRTYKECKGKYVAICDGDDYWIEPLKLQHQVDILERDNELAIVFSNYIEQYNSGKEVTVLKEGISVLTDFKDLVLGNFIHSVTVVFKNKPLTPQMAEWILKYPYGDWPTYLWVLSENGKIFFSEKVTAVYRKNIGISSEIMKRKSGLGEINLNILQSMLRDKNFSCRKEEIKISIIRHKIGLMGSYNKEKQYMKAINLLIGFLGKSNFFYVTRLYFYSLKRTFI